MTAAVDVAAIAKRLTHTQRRVLAAVPNGLVHRALYGAGRSIYLIGWPVAITTTGRALIRADLIRTAGNQDYELTDLGRAVLDHITALQSDRGSVDRGVAMFLGIVAFVAVMLACFGNWESW